MTSTTVQQLCILGSTGSVGGSTLDVVARHPDRFQVLALTANQRVDELAAQCERWRPRFAAMPDEAHAKALRERLSQRGIATEVLHGAKALCDLSAHPDVDLVMAAIVGAAGLAPCLAAAAAGKRLLLANKEAIVLGGAVFMDAVRAGGASLVPIDSEHSAIFQCLPERRETWSDRIDHLLLTASGGPFRSRDPSTFVDITPEQAVAHPNWVMGRKISVDSATMMNKALEVIEAHWLFGLAPDRIRVVIHPQSIVHSMVVCRDGSVLAQLGTPDMRGPIAFGLAYPDRIETGAPRLDFMTLGALTFEPVDPVRFPGLSLAWAALAGPHGTTAVLNAANEEAVAAFLDRKVPFTAIHRINADTLATVDPGLSATAGLGDLLELDHRARLAARRIVAGLCS